MELKEYFANTNGRAFLSTMDNDGNVDSAVYSSPQFFDDGRIGLIMSENLSYTNVQANPQVCLLFVEHGERDKGKRLYLKKVGETDDKDVIEPLLEESMHDSDEDAVRHLVYFELVKERPLVGGGV